MSQYSRKNDVAFLSISRSGTCDRGESVAVQNCCLDTEKFRQSLFQVDVNI